MGDLSHPAAGMETCPTSKITLTTYIYTENLRNKIIAT